MPLCLGIQVAKQKFCFCLEGASALREPGGADRALHKAGFWGLSREVPGTWGTVVSETALSGKPSKNPPTSEMGCDVPFPEHQTPTRMGLSAAGHCSGERVQRLKEAQRQWKPFEAD